jgi:hypothetical protein
MAYCLSPTVGTGHTFTGHGINGASIEVMAFSGSGTFQAGTDKGVNTASVPVSPGSVTPTNIGDLVISGYVNHATGAGTSPQSVDSGLTISDGGEAGFGSASAAYLVTTGAGAVNPAWTSTNPFQVFNASACIAVFNAA